eukprot:940022-Rhodomonas_salina.1
MHHLPPSHHHDLLDLLGVEVCPYALSGSEMLYAAPVSAYALAMHCPLWACCCTGRSRVVITCMITCVLGVQDGNDWDDPPSEPHESIKAMALLYHQVSSLFFFSLDLDFDLDLEMENLTSIPIWIAISIASARRRSRTGSSPSASSQVRPQIRPESNTTTQNHSTLCISNALDLAVSTQS